MMNPRLAVGVRRTLKKHEVFFVFASLDAFFKNIIFAPKRQNALFNVREQQWAIFLLIHALHDNKKTAACRRLSRSILLMPFVVNICAIADLLTRKMSIRVQLL